VCGRASKCALGRALQQGALTRCWPWACLASGHSRLKGIWRALPGAPDPRTALQVDPTELHLLILLSLATGPCREAAAALEREAAAHGLLPVRTDFLGALPRPCYSSVPGCSVRRLRQHDTLLSLCPALAHLAAQGITREGRGAGAAAGRAAAQGPPPCEAPPRDVTSAGARTVTAASCTLRSRTDGPAAQFPCRSSQQRRWGLEVRLNHTRPRASGASEAQGEPRSAAAVV